MHPKILTPPCSPPPEGLGVGPPLPTLPQGFQEFLIRDRRERGEGSVPWENQSIRAVFKVMCSTRNEVLYANFSEIANDLEYQQEAGKICQEL